MRSFLRQEDKFASKKNISNYTQNTSHKTLPQYCHPDEGGTPLETPQNKSHNIKTTREILPESG